MDIKGLNISGEFEIIGFCNNFTLSHCKQITKVVGSAIKMVLTGSGISGDFNIPEYCDYIDLRDCEDIGNITGYANIMLT